MGSLFLIAGLVATWLLFRMLAGRATLGLSTYVLIFALGAASSVIGVALERIAYAFFELQTVGRLLNAPIDEISKALPLLIVIARFRTSRRLTISDYALVGLAVGLGYEFVNWDLAALSGLMPPAWHLPVFGSLFNASEWEHAPAYFMGAITTAFVGLAAGICVRLNLPRRGVVLATLLALLLVTFENGMYRWQVGPLLWAGQPAHLAPVLAPIRILHELMLDGRLELFLLVIGLLIGNWLEGRWVRFTVPEAANNFLLDEDATTALVPVEMIVAGQRLFAGWCAFAEINRFFRDRRAYALIEAEACRSPSGVALQARAAEMKRSLSERYAGINAPSAAVRFKWRGIGKLPGPVIAANRYFIVVAFLFLIYAMVPPNAWHGFKFVLYGDWTALALIVASIGILALRRFRAGSPDGLRGKTGETFETGLDDVVARSAAILSVIALAAWFEPFETLAPHYGAAPFTPLEPFEIWVTGPGYPVYGGSPHSFFAAMAATLAGCVALRLSARRMPMSVSDLTLQPVNAAEGA
jgi:hypothetical protein